MIYFSLCIYSNSISSYILHTMLVLNLGIVIYTLIMIKTTESYFGYLNVTLTMTCIILSSIILLLYIMLLLYNIIIQCSFLLH